MKLKTIVTASFFISILLYIIGSYLKILHLKGAETWLIGGIMVSIVFIVAAIREVWASRRMDHTEKMVWSLAFIFFSSIAGLLYMLIGRKKVLHIQGSI